jgi:hypothetical protein
MSIARRTFLKTATLTTLSAGLTISSANLVFGQSKEKSAKRPDSGDTPEIPIEAQRDALAFFRASTFSPYVGDIFQAPNSLGEMIELKLTGVSEYRISTKGRALARQARQPESFTLKFSASQELPPFSSIHQMSHPALGKFDLFLTSRKADNGDLIYEAVFSHAAQ